MRNPIAVAAVLTIASVAAGCGGRDRVTVVTPPPAAVTTPVPSAAVAPATVIADPAGFHGYVVTQRVPSYRYTGDVAVGVELPPAGVSFYDVPPRFGVTEYRYTVVNDRLVLVDPATHRIVQVIR